MEKATMDIVRGGKFPKSGENILNKDIVPDKDELIKTLKGHKLPINRQHRIMTKIEEDVDELRRRNDGDHLSNLL